MPEEDERDEMPGPGAGPNAPNRDAPLGYHRNKDGKVVRNRGRREKPKGEEQDAVDAGRGYGSQRFQEDAGNEAGATGQPIPPKFIEKLEAAGLTINENGEIVFLSQEPGAGAGQLGDEDQLALAQQAYERFGLASNPFYDPRRVAFTGEFHQGATGDRVPDFIDLGTGLYVASGSQVANDELLTFLRARTGYDPEYERERLAASRTYNDPLNQGSTYTPGFLQSAESYQAYLDAARANYQATFASGPGVPGQPPGGTAAGATPEAGGFDPGTVETAFGAVSDSDLGIVNETVARMLDSRRNRQRAQSFYGDYFRTEDFTGEVE